MPSLVVGRRNSEMNKQSKGFTGWQTMWNHSYRNMQKYYVNPEEWHIAHFSGMSMGWERRREEEFQEVMMLGLNI